MKSTMSCLRLQKLKKIIKGSCSDLRGMRDQIACWLKILDCRSSLKSTSSIKKNQLKSIKMVSECTQLQAVCMWGKTNQYIINI